MSQIVIQKLIILGPRYKRTLDFDEGLNIIRGDRTSGKSLVLNLIDYCLGKKSKIDLKVQKELNKHCDRIFIELKIDNEIITLFRLLKEKQTKIGIYFCSFSDIDEYIPKRVEVKEAMQLLMRKLNINEYKRSKYKAHSNEQEIETISFRDIFRYVYIKQHSLGTDDFLENKSVFVKNKNPYAFEMIFNLTEHDKNQLLEEIVNIKNKIINLNKEIEGYTTYLRVKEAEDFNELTAKANKIEDKIKEQIVTKESIIRQNGSNTISENNMYIKLKNRLLKLTNEINDLHNLKGELQTSLVSKKLLIVEYETEKFEIDTTLEINYKLVVPEQDIECPLCHSTVKSHIHNISRPDNMLNKIQKEIENKIKLVNSIVEKEENKIIDIEESISKLLKEQSILETAIQEFAKETSVPFLSIIDSINSLINNYNKEKEIINECIRIHHKIDETNDLIGDLDREKERLEKELEKLKISEDNKKEIFEFINKKYKHYMERLKYNVGEDTYIDYEKYIPYHEGASVFEHESGGLIECMQIAYLASILESKKERYAVGHPGVLLLDTLSKYLGTIKTEHGEESIQVEERINDPEVYEEIYKILLELGKDYQIIVVDNTPPKLYTPYTKYTFLAGEKGLINLNVNEIKGLE
ncbi:hypothetical protein FOH38_03255 [Lysinibacillus fusiformis]|nr:hypothetical protein FOH38_03255 [Lysinibacillus fusiformis]